MGVTFDFKNSDSFVINELKKDCSSSTIEYLDSFCKEIDKFRRELNYEANNIESISQALGHVYGTSRMFVDESNEDRFEKLISVSD